MCGPSSLRSKRITFWIVACGSGEVSSEVGGRRSRLICWEGVCISAMMRIEDIVFWTAEDATAADAAACGERRVEDESAFGIELFVLGLG